MGAESKGSGNGNDSQQETAAAKPIVEETNPFDDLFAPVVVGANRPYYQTAGFSPP
jgi:hypothetical protein